MGSSREMRRALRIAAFIARIPRAVTWAVREHRRLGHALEIDGVRAAVQPPVRRLPGRTGQVVAGTLRVRRATCLERALIMQAWLSANGSDHDVVIGVRRDRDFTAHAWLDRLEQHPEYVEIHRLPAR